MYGILGLLIFFLDIFAIADCIESPMDSAKKTLWILLVLALPFAGMLLYFILAKKSFNY